MSLAYAELHCKSFYSFGQGASHVHELLARAVEYGYPALALTDANLCGALEFARLANSLGIKPITGCELTLTDGSRLTLLARTREGYGNTSRLLTLANGHDRREPRLDPAYLPAHAGGTVLLTGGRDNLLSNLVKQGRQAEASDQLRRYMDWHGPNGVYLELQQNLLHGDTKRNRQMFNLARDCGVPVVATGDALYHTSERYRLQHALVAAAHNTTIDRALRYIRPNERFHLKSVERMQKLFRHCPEALDNTLRDRLQICDFNLDTDLGYRLPDADVPEGFTPQTYLERLCYESVHYGAIGSSSPSKIQASRLDKEFRLIELHGMAGFLLLYREIALIAREIMLERGLVSPEVPLEARPPGRGRGSSVALLVGYLIGISHIDPLAWDLSLERFISEDVGTLPDIDLDFPRGIRDALIERVHQRRFDPEHAVLTGRNRHIQDEGRHPGPGQGARTAARAAKDAVQAGTLRRPQDDGRRDAPHARLQGQGGCAGLENACRTRAAAHRRATLAWSACGRNGAEQLAHPGACAGESGGNGWALHNGLEQGQRAGRRIRQDRYSVPAGARPDRGGTGSHRAARRTSVRI